MSDITEAVQTCLKKVLQKLEVQNYSIDLSNWTLKHNLMGVITKVKTTWKTLQGEEVVLNFIIKSAPRFELHQSNVLVPLAYTREIYVYKTILHEFVALQRERGVGKPFQAYPKYYDSLMDNASSSIIMEDLSEIGFKLHIPLRYDHVRAVLKEYAKFHALSFAMRLHKPEVFKKFSEETQESLVTAPEFTWLLKSSMEQSKKVLAVIDPIEEIVLYKKFQVFLEKTVEDIQNIVKSDLDDPHCVITHGDCSFNNLLFTDIPGDQGKLPDVRILDWQLATYGSPALDLGFLIFVCTDKDLRDKHYCDLIETYYEAFSDFLTDLGGDPKRQFPFETLEEHLKKYCVFGLHMALFSLIFDVDSVEENSAHLKEEIRIKKIKNILIDFERLGYNFQG